MRARMVLRDIWQGFRLDVVNIKYSNDVLIEICKIFIESKYSKYLIGSKYAKY